MEVIHMTYLTIVCADAERATYKQCSILDAGLEEIKQFCHDYQILHVYGSLSAEARETMNAP